jgi:flagellar biogenesis protein FliO
MIRICYRLAIGALTGLLLVVAQAAMAAQAPADAPRSAPGTGVTNSAPAFPAEIPLRRYPPDEGMSGGRMAFGVWSLVAIGALVWSVMRLRRRGQQQPGKTGFSGLGGTLTRMLGRSSTRGPIVMGATRLTARHSVHVVAWNQTEYLLACSEQGVTLLAQRTPQGGVSAQESQTL